jgi:hypothetical protein
MHSHGNAVLVRVHTDKELDTRCNCAATSRARRGTEERVQANAAGQVVLKLKTPWRDGTTHLVMSPLQFMQRLAAPAPRIMCF